MDKIGIIGATGWLGRALALNLLDRGIVPANALVLLNRSGPSDLFAAHPAVTWAKDAASLCDQCGTLVLSVRPEDFPVAGFAPRDHLVLSFMAAWSMDDLAALAPAARIVRAMPNGGATTGQSYTPWLARPDLPPADAATVTRLLSAMGQSDRIGTEDQLHYLSALSGSGAAYPALLAKAMLDDAAARGLPPEIARRAVEAVVCGSAGLLAGKLDSLSGLLDAYMSYRGITAAGLSAAHAAGFEQSIHAALSAALEKARSMTPQ